MTHFSHKLITSARIGKTGPAHFGHGPESLPDMDNLNNFSLSIIFNSLSEAAVWAE
jgi:hypothetical protein